MLTDLDETLLHQAAATFDNTNISDHRFFDRMVVGFHKEDAANVIMGLAKYKNMNTFEGFACIQHGESQHNLRVARPLRPDVNDMVNGPVSVEFIEPLKSLRIKLDPGEHNTSFDVIYTGLTPPYEEGYHIARSYGRLSQDYMRFDQVGVMNGWLDVGGEKMAVDNWYTFRDHSWGVRPGVGGFEPQTGPRPPGVGSLFIWLAFTTEEMGGQFQMAEDSEGKRMNIDGHMSWPEGSGKDVIFVTDLEHDISFVPGTRVFDKAQLMVTTSDGQKWDIQAEAAGRSWVFKGTGYDGGYNDGLSLGAYRGEVYEHDVYDVTHPEETILPNGDAIRPVHREQPVKLTVNGKPGYGHLPVINWGVVKKYGLS